MNDNFIFLNNDISDALSFGNTLKEPAFHFSRVFSTFAPAERVKMLEEAFREYKTIEIGRYILEQFVALALFGDIGGAPDPRDEAGRFFDEDPSESRRLLKLCRDRIHKWDGCAAKVDLNDLSDDEIKTVRSTIRGNSYRGLAIVLAGTVFDSELATSEDFAALFSGSLGKAILTPEQAAAVSSCVEQNRTLARNFAGEAGDLIQDFQYQKSNIGKHRKIFESILNKITSLEYYLGNHIFSVSAILEAQDQVVRPDDLLGRFELEKNNYGLYIPKKQGIVIAHTLRDAVAAAEKDKSSLLNMSPRGFEEFMAAIFQSLGFEVELTQTSRDGGADILCLQDHHGIPLRIAVEVKRYKEDRPVTVELVRSFYGANAQHKANKLIFVTTSHYTKPARDYVANYASHLMELKKYEHIKEWCSHFLRVN